MLIDAFPRLARFWPAADIRDAHTIFPAAAPREAADTITQLLRQEEMQFTLDYFMRRVISNHFAFIMIIITTMHYAAPRRVTGRAISHQGVVAHAFIFASSSPTKIIFTLRHAVFQRARISFTLFPADDDYDEIL